jgi:hypothetical protein
MSGLRDISRVNTDTGRDLWPRFRERLTAPERVMLEMPAVTWGIVAAGLVSAAVLALVPEPARLLAASGLL